jgi:hypothetical protein
MLDLRLSEESNGGFRSGIPEALASKTKGVEEAKDRVALLGQNSKVIRTLHGQRGLGSHALAHRCSIEAGGGESGGSASQKSGNKELHCRVIYFRMPKLTRKPIFLHFSKDTLGKDRLQGISTTGSTSLHEDVTSDVPVPRYRTTPAVQETIFFKVDVNVRPGRMPSVIVRYNMHVYAWLVASGRTGTCTNTSSLPVSS